MNKKKISNLNVVELADQLWEDVLPFAKLKKIKPIQYYRLIPYIQNPDVSPHFISCKKINNKNKTERLREHF